MKSQRKKMSWIILLLGSIGYNSNYANPLFAINTPYWSDSSRIFLANCNASAVSVEDIERISRVKPKTEWQIDSRILDLIPVWAPHVKYPQTVFTGWEDFKEKNKLRKPMVYAVQDTGLRGTAMMFQLDGTTGEETTCYALPHRLKQGYLRVEEVYVTNAWRTILLMVGTRYDNSEIEVFVWDVTNPTVPFRLVLNLSAEVLALKDLSKPYFFRLPNQEWQVAIPGKWNGEGAIILLSLEHPSKTIVLTTGQAEAVTAITPIDSLMNWIVDAVYAIDSSGSIWHFNLSPLFKSVGNKVAHQVVTRTLEPLRVRKSRDTKQMELLYVGKNEQGEIAIMRLNHNAQADPMASIRAGAEIVVVGDYLAPLIAMDTLILISKYGDATPSLLSGQNIGYTSMKADWDVLTTPQGPSAENQYSKLQWDRKHQQDVVVTLNNNCQLTITKTNINKNKYGRLVWRRIN